MLGLAPELHLPVLLLTPCVQPGSPVSRQLLNTCRHSDDCWEHIYEQLTDEAAGGWGVKYSCRSYGLCDMSCITRL